MNQNIKRMATILAAVVISVILFCCPAFGSGLPPEKGDLLPDIALPVPDNPSQRSYLGLSDQTVFKIPEIKAKVVIIEIFSMYCPYCQREAEEVNRLYSIIENDPTLKDKIKVIGIGTGNSTFEVEVFRNKFSVPFPLIADENYSVHKSFGEVRTPYFLGVKINEDGTHRVFYSKPGEFNGAEQFLELMLRLSGLIQGK
ncbi:MAG TPA: redoxin domain-containing protein [Desulfatiglandales bacterium]|nr:redoxin domain-containing protein [Desulfatiglandales bacterium]